jgi:hypothetical protein
MVVSALVCREFIVTLLSSNDLCRMIVVSAGSSDEHNVLPAHDRNWDIWTWENEAKTARLVQFRPKRSAQHKHDRDSRVPLACNDLSRNDSAMRIAQCSHDDSSPRGRLQRCDIRAFL